jgi:hypothetical protein
VKRKSDSSDDQIIDDEEEKSREPQQKQLVPSLWVTAKGEALPEAKRRKSDEGEYLGT